MGRDRPQAGLSGSIGFSETIHTHIDRYLESVYHGELGASIAAVDTFEDLMAAYFDETYKEEREELQERWEELEKQRRRDREIAIDAYETIRARFRALVRLASRRQLIPQGSPNPTTV